MITAEMVKQLRERTGSGMMDCKGPDGCGWQYRKAIEILRKGWALLPKGRKDRS